MSVSGLCGICETAEATDQCQQCGTLVCRRHYVRDEGICVSCHTGPGLS